MREVSFDEFKENAFNLIGKEWLINAIRTKTFMLCM